MADVVKLVDRGIPANQRSQSFDQTDGGTGDVLMIEQSLGRHAHQLTLEAVGAMTIRLNVYRYVFPQRKTGQGFTQWWPGISNVAQGTLVKSDSNALIALDAGDIFELSNEMPVSDIEIVSAAGDFSVLVT